LCFNIKTSCVIVNSFWEKYFVNSKQRIGDRIATCRKERGFTLKELAEKTSMSGGRIGNWEQGTRSPGPQEAKLLADALGVASSYLLGLTDSRQGEIHWQNNLPKSTPIIPLAQINQPKTELLALIHQMTPWSKEKNKIFLTQINSRTIGAHTFATQIEDNSMSPEFLPGDLVIADPDIEPNPGQYVLSHIKSSGKNILRKYRQSESQDLSHYELTALNPDWGSNYITNREEAQMLATVIEHRRFFN
jgi:transcriptional regulator with XRE-family HTH domain